MMIRSLRIKLLPNNKQRTKLFQFAGASRFAYNWALIGRWRIIMGAVSCRVTANCEGNLQNFAIQVRRLGY